MSLGEHTSPYADLAGIRGLVATMYMTTLTATGLVHALPALIPGPVLNALLRHPDHIFILGVLVQASASAVGD